MAKISTRQILAYGLIAAMLLSTFLYLFQQFKPASTPQSHTPTKPRPAVNQVAVPDFSADSAYLFVGKQVKFGPRVPNTEAHRKCAAWMAAEFKRYGLSVIEQKFQTQHYKGTVFNANNVIAQYKPEIPRRILLAAHWDSRFMADHDTANQDKPIDGADDGASGIGVLLELARTLSKHPVEIGVDFVCFDVEDQGDDNGASETWCLGSQYWAKNLHKPNYMPYQAVLLDMVGGKDARFYKEGVSVEVAPRTVDKIWEIAVSQGFMQYFIPENRPGITDDHLFVVKGARIPMIDIISTPNTGSHPFPDWHHKHADTMDNIDRNTLKAVGQTLTVFIYQTYNLEG